MTDLSRPLAAVVDALPLVPGLRALEIAAGTLSVRWAAAEGCTLNDDRER